MEKIKITKHAILRFLQRYSSEKPDLAIWYINHMVNNAEKRWITKQCEYRKYGNSIFICIKKEYKYSPLIYVVTMFSADNKAKSKDNPDEKYLEQLSEAIYQKAYGQINNTLCNKEGKDDIVPSAGLSLDENIILEQEIVQLDENNFIVPSKHNTGQNYIVDLAIPSCNCKAFTSKKKTNGVFQCSHITTALQYLYTLGSHNAFTWENALCMYPIYINSIRHDYFKPEFIDFICPSCSFQLSVERNLIPTEFGFEGTSTCIECAMTYNFRSKIWVCNQERIHCRKTIYSTDGKKIQETSITQERSL